MKNKFTLLVVLLFAGILSTQAQGQRRTIEERVQMTVSRVTDSLSLSAAQKTDAQNTFTEYYTSMDKLREGLEPGKRPEKQPPKPTLRQFPAHLVHTASSLL